MASPYVEPELSGADPSTFEVVNFWFAKDQHRVYHNGPGVLEGADPATLRLRPPCDVCAQDKHRCYRFNEVVACGQP